MEKGCFSKNSSGEFQQQVVQRREHVIILAQTLVSQRLPQSAALVHKLGENKEIKTSICLCSDFSSLPMQLYLQITINGCPDNPSKQTFEDTVKKTMERQKQ